MPYRALQYLLPLLEHPDYNEPGLWLSLLECHCALDGGKGAAAAGGEAAGRGRGAAEGVRLYREQLEGMDKGDPRCVGRRTACALRRTCGSPMSCPCRMAEQCSASRVALPETQPTLSPFLHPSLCQATPFETRLCQHPSTAIPLQSLRVDSALLSPLLLCLVTPSSSPFFPLATPFACTRPTPFNPSSSLPSPPRYAGALLALAENCASRGDRSTALELMDELDAMVRQRYDAMQHENEQQQADMEVDSAAAAAAEGDSSAARGGPSSAAAEAGGSTAAGGEAGDVTPGAPTLASAAVAALGEEGLMRKSQLHLQLGQPDRWGGNRRAAKGQTETLGLRRAGFVAAGGGGGELARECGPTPHV